jgi:signal transduction histidine kinase
LIHELQKERGASSGYIGIRGEEMAGELNSQRLITDQKYSILKRYLDSTDIDQYGQKCCEQLELFLKDLDDLSNVRKDILSLSITRNQSIDYFSKINKEIISSFQEANITIKDSPLSFPFTACINFIMAKEMAGVERALMTGFAADDKPVSESDMHKWMRVLKGQDALFSAFEHQIHVAGKIQEEFQNVFSGDYTKMIIDIRRQLYEKHRVGNYELMPLDVFAVATWRIDELQKIEDMQTNKILHSAEKYLARKTNSFIMYIALTATSVIAIFVLSIINARRITRPITILSNATKRFASGNLDYKVEIRSKNEIGELAYNFIQMRTQRQKIENEREALINKLKYLNKELEGFAYVVSHDLKAPLRAIHNYADFLQTDLKGKLEEEQEMYLDRLGKAVRQSEDLIEDILMLSRIGKHQIEIKNIDMETFVQDLIPSLDLPSDVEIVIKDGWPTMDAETTLLRQIFQNLILNGIKFNKSSIKTIEIGWHQRDNEYYEFFVKDNGIGIDERFFEKIFRPFQRLHTTKEYEGTGIGLAAVIRAVNMLQWSVRVESKPGEGSTFFVTIPKV